VVQHTLALRRTNRAGISSRPGLRVGGQKGLIFVFSYFEQTHFTLESPFFKCFPREEKPALRFFTFQVLLGEDADL
jgi:hypothetical protein